MCTIVILRHVHSEWPLVLAANRDEFYGRPTQGPQLLSESPRVVGGRDVERGGTWMGTTDSGLFVGLTMLWWLPILFGEDFSPSIPVAAVIIIAVVLGTPGSIAGLCLARSFFVQKVFGSSCVCLVKARSVG